jgi:hypothetical protein
MVQPWDGREELRSRIFGGYALGPDYRLRNSVSDKFLSGATLYPAKQNSSAYVLESHIS